MGFSAIDRITDTPNKSSRTWIENLPKVTNIPKGLTSVCVLFGCFPQNMGTAKWMVYNGKPYQNGWFRGTTIFGNPHFLRTQHTSCHTPLPPLSSLDELRYYGLRSPRALEPPSHYSERLHQNDLGITQEPTENYQQVGMMTICWWLMVFFSGGFQHLKGFGLNPKL